MAEPKSIDEHFTEIAPKASRIALSSFIGWTEEKFNQDIAEGIISAMKKLPANGPIRKKNGKRIVKAISWLLDDIPKNDKRKAEIVEWIGEALKRMR